MVRVAVAASLFCICACGDSAVATVSDASDASTTPTGDAATEPTDTGEPPTSGPGTDATTGPTTDTTTDTATATTVDTATGPATTEVSTETDEPVENCAGGDLWVNDPAEFAKLDGFNCIEGNVRLFPGSGTDLAAMSEIRSIGGWLHLDEGHELVSLHGLEQLRSIGKGLHFAPTALADASALAGLESIAGGLELVDAPQLAALELPALTSFAGKLRITAASLTTLDLGAADEAFAVELTSTRLTTLAGLDSLTKLTTLTLSGNLELEDLAGLDGLTVMAGSVIVEDSPQLVDVAGLGGLTSANSLTVRGTEKLTTLAPLAGLQLGTLWLEDNAGLVELASFGAAELSILRILGNPALVDLDGLEAITAVSQLGIIGNPKLVDLQGLAGLGGTIDDVTIEDNAALVSLAGAGGLGAAGNVDIVDNPVLADLELLTGLDHLASLSVRGSNLADLGDLAALKTVAGSLRIRDNPALTSLAGLEKLVSAESLMIEESPKLGSVAALQSGALTTVTTYFGMTDNAMVATCTAKAILDSLAPPPPYYCYSGNKQDACSVGEICVLRANP